MIKYRERYEALWYNSWYNLDFDGTYDNYVEQMRKSVTWGSYFEVHVLSELFRATVVIRGPSCNHQIRHQDAE